MKLGTDYKIQNSHLVKSEGNKCTKQLKKIKESIYKQDTASGIAGFLICNSANLASAMKRSRSLRNVST